ncbi:MAG: 23S rRNA (uracil(1939)-C(5))-methyltransferase RlmD [Candidatus Cloacimonetes bacterium]|nr:23S rRNA (uracil(1939)-C(5))-methyltransferase RlmD [Candidatus Cloacimonadota bacterium]
MAITLDIQKIAMGGMGLGFHDGRAIFVPYTAIGDSVEIEFTRTKKDHAFGRVIRYLKRGEGVKEPECSAFGEPNNCGGCDWLMLEYPKQLEYKSQLLSELFKDYPQIEIAPIIASPQPRHYRNKVFLPVGKANYGIYAKRSHEIIPHQACQNHPPIFDSIAQELFSLCQKAKVEAYDEVAHSGTLRHIGLRCNQDQNQVLVILVTRTARLPFSQSIVRALTQRFATISGIIQNINRHKSNVILGEEDKLLYGAYHLQDSLLGQSFNVHYRSFWQVNSGSMESILQELKSRIKPGKRLIDAYCGSGSIGIALADNALEIVGIEENPKAVENARSNAALNGLSNARFIAGKCEEILPELLQNMPADAIILDPPRSGVDEAALRGIIQAEIPELWYLSCSPLSLRRDIKLLETGGYELISLASFDMFPNTWHIEALACLRLRK